MFLPKTAQFFKIIYFFSLSIIILNGILPGRLEIQILSSLVKIAQL